MATNVIGKRYSVSEGPFKWDIESSMFHSTNKHPRTAPFIMRDGPNGPGLYELHIHGAEHEDGSGESWLIRRASWTSTTGVRACYRVEGYCSTKNRENTGYLVFTPA